MIRSFRKSIFLGRQRVFRLGTDGTASGEYKGRLCPGTERRAIRSTARSNWRSFHSEAHEKAK